MTYLTRRVAAKRLLVGVGCRYSLRYSSVQFDCSKADDEDCKY